jgi:hypothetical protein
LYHPDAISQEPDGVPWATAYGMEEMQKKGEAWGAMMEEIHDSAMSDQIVAGNHFSVRMMNEATFKGSSERQKLDEIGVYEVKDGKIVKEQVFYNV